VRPDKIGRLSGTGWATVMSAASSSLILVLGFLAANPPGRTLFGFVPLSVLIPLRIRVTASPDR